MVNINCPYTLFMVKIITTIGVIGRVLPDHELAERVRSVNLHITKACNYRCKFCYAHFNQVSNHLTMDDWQQIITMLAEAGTQKVTFVGGEPTLVPFLPELVIHAKGLGMTTMVVTNGTKMSGEYLQRFDGELDWVGLSIDSGDEEVSAQLGRGNGGHVRQTIELADRLRRAGIEVKVNTVVTRLTWEEDMTWLIERIRPRRWKVFQMLPIEGENDGGLDLLITDEQFHHFVERHSHLSPVSETNDDMIESYVMVDPEGRFFTNSGYRLTHHPSILEVGVAKALDSVPFDVQKLIARGGIYNWEGGR